LIPDFQSLYLSGPRGAWREKVKDKLGERAVEAPPLVLPADNNWFSRIAECDALLLNLEGFVRLPGAEFLDGILEAQMAADFDLEVYIACEEPVETSPALLWGATQFPGLDHFLREANA
jgi:hypothetical protein